MEATSLGVSRCYCRQWLRARLQDTLMLSGPSGSTIFTWVTIETRSALLDSGALVVTLLVHQFESTSLLVRPPK